MIGNVTRKEIKMDKYLEFTQTKINIIKEATGIVFIIEIIGERKSRSNLSLHARPPNTTARRNPLKKPRQILQSE